MSTLLDLIQTKVNYVVQEAIVVIRDIFRKYPNKYVKVVWRGLGALVCQHWMRAMYSSLSTAYWGSEAKVPGFLKSSVHSGSSYSYGGIQVWAVGEVSACDTLLVWIGSFSFPTAPY